MRYTLLFVLAAFLLSGVFVACKSTKNKGSDDSTNARKVHTTIDVDLLSNVWKHVKSKDAYDGIWKTVENGKVISFTTDGAYTEKTAENPLYEGTYTASGESLSINHSGNTATLPYHVEYLKKKKLVLSFQARHGKLVEVFERVQN